MIVHPLVGLQVVPVCWIWAGRLLGKGCVVGWGDGRQICEWLEPAVPEGQSLMLLCTHEATVISVVPMIEKVHTEAAEEGPHETHDYAIIK